MMKFDQRIIMLAIEIDGILHTYSDLSITASGEKTTGSQQNECTITITNLNKSVRDYLITEASPHNNPKKRKKVILYAGRESIGTFKMFEGDIVECTTSQPPDIVLTIKARTGAFFMTNFVNNSYSDTILLSKVATDISVTIDVTLDFQAQDKNISNYNYTGATLQQMKRLEDAGNYNVYLDDDRLVIKDSDKALDSSQIVINKNTGMIGIPELTSDGVKVKYLLDPLSRPGAKLIVESELNPAANGTYSIFKLGYEVSNNNESFYYTAECRRIN